MKKFDYLIVEEGKCVVFDAEKYTLEQADLLARDLICVEDYNFLITYDWMRYELIGNKQGGYVFCDENIPNAFPVISVVQEDIYD